MPDNIRLFLILWDDQKLSHRVLYNINEPGELRFPAGQRWVFPARMSMMSLVIAPFFVAPFVSLLAHTRQVNGGECRIPVPHRLRGGGRCGTPAQFSDFNPAVYGYRDGFAPFAVLLVRTQAVTEENSRRRSCVGWWCFRYRTRLND